MKVDRLLAIVSIVISLAAIAASVVGLKRDPLGTDISAYDLSSPENTLRSINKVVANQDLRAAWQLLKVNLLSNSSPEMKLFLSNDLKIQVLRSVEVANSADATNNGLIVSFVKFTIAGVDYQTVRYFRKDQSNRFVLGSAFYVPYGTKKSDQDKALEASINAFENTNKEPDGFVPDEDIEEFTPGKQK